ncbi:hypothetical protein KUTeg_021497 [Tegillarca granosa]|uniref:Uncharacterized protein n=1 Tax=Tegillarca granosa TaxID=220873 RepID=A0ABQ9E3G4_TEGGR|nr:hypothetical protein KUTeg_021497 [Tegillarca granosa]
MQKENCTYPRGNTSTAHLKQIKQADNDLSRVKLLARVKLMGEYLNSSLYVTSNIYPTSDTKCHRMIQAAIACNILGECQTEYFKQLLVNIMQKENCTYPRGITSTTHLKQISRIHDGFDDDGVFDAGSTIKYLQKNNVENKLVVVS